MLKDNGWIIFDDFNWTYASADKKKDVTDGITHRKLSEEERNTPHIKEIFELLVKQHSNYSDLVVYRDSEWAVARKTASERKTYTIKFKETNKDVLLQLKHKIISLMARNK